MSYKDRHEAAMEVMKRMDEGPAGSVGNADPERVSRFFSRSKGALGSFAIDIVLGQVWARKELSRRDRSLIVISVLMALCSKDELTYHLKVALNHGVSREEVEEVLLHVAVYAGFPAAMPATRVWDDVIKRIDGVDRIERKPAVSMDDADRWKAAAGVRTTMTDGKSSPDPAESRASMVKALGPVGEIAFDFAFGEVWSRPQMQKRDRSIVVISILTALARPEELAFHIPVGLTHGLSRIEIEEIMVQMTIYGGMPKAVEGISVARRAFAKVDGTAKARL
jgi:4-carboxymuconolactone decarboxylase